jgi:hypothetical protein
MLTWIQTIVGRRYRDKGADLRSWSSSLIRPGDLLGEMRLRYRPGRSTTSASTVALITASSGSAGWGSHGHPARTRHAQRIQPHLAEPRHAHAELRCHRCRTALQPLQGDAARLLSRRA